MVKDDIGPSAAPSPAPARIAQPSRKAQPPRRRYRLCWIRCSALLFCVTFWVLVGLGLARLFS